MNISMIQLSATATRWHRAKIMSAVKTSLARPMLPHGLSPMFMVQSAVEMLINFEVDALDRWSCSGGWHK